MAFTKEQAPCHKKVEAMLAEIERRYGQKKTDRELRLNMIAVKRIRDIERYLEGRYGRVLPDDDAGREDFVILLNHLAHNPIDPQGKMRRAIYVWAPSMAPAEGQDLVESIAKKPRRYRAKTLARLMRVTEEEHARWGLGSIWAFTWTGADMKDRERRRERKRKATKRRSAGTVDREEWLATSKSRTKPWEAMGISRAEYYRRRKAGTLHDTPSETGPSALLESSYRADTPVSREVSPPSLKPWQVLGISKRTYFRWRKAGKMIPSETKRDGISVPSEIRVTTSPHRSLASFPDVSRNRAPSSSNHCKATFPQTGTSSLSRGDGPAWEKGGRIRSEGGAVGYEL
jgi:hypothetical protein